MIVFSRTPRQGHPKRWARLGLGLLLAAISGTTQAQFNGPALGSAAGVNRPVTVTTDPAILYPAGRELRLAAGDDITVRVYGPSNYQESVRVSLDGSIQLPLAGLIQVAGLTLHAAEDRIGQQLTAAGMFQNPQVTLQLVLSPNQVATVAGEVHAVVPVAGQRRLFDVLAAAGGLPITASHVVTISRPGNVEPIVVDLGTDPLRSAEANIPIFPGDTVLVSRVGVVYMLGAFKTQGQIPLAQSSPLTLMQAAAMAGGVGFEGKYRDMKIIRTEGVTRKMVPVNIKKVMSGKAPDPILQADDIVLLPDDIMKSAIKAGGIQTLLGVASILIYLRNTN